MKDRPLVYAQHQYAPSSEPQYVVSIEFSPASFEYFASHPSITDIPGGTIESVFEDFSAVSQSFDPETGASRIGSLTVQLGDIAGAITDAFQARLAAGTGVRDKQLRLYKGFAGMSFNDFELKWTQRVHEVSEDHARYTISCSDLQRAMRTEIFELKTTVLDATLSATASTATVAATADFILVAHGTSYSHGPSATWGYFKLDDEIIGYTGKTATTFTGLDRGLFNTLPAEHIVDGADPPERRPVVEEYVYLEMPIPKLVKALLTGVLHGQGANLPAHWHMGIDTALVEDSQFTGIGPDLWDPANDAVGLPARFTDIDSIDGKRFIESECFLLAQIFSPVLSDGKLGLRRFTPALATAAHLVTLNESNVVKHTSLKHSMRAVFNRIVLNWSWIAGEFRRQTIKLDTDSIAKHGEAPIKVYNFRGLSSNIATQSVLTQRFDAIRDRFSAPPLSIGVDVSKSLDRMELGDVCLVQLPNVRDMAAASVNAIDRAFEIRQIREDRKRLTFALSGSSAESLPVAPSVNALADGFYDSEGTELSTVVPITGGVTDAGTTTVVGGPLLASSVFYFIGNLTIAATTTLNLDDNVQLRVRGFLTVNGVLNGNARGLAGVVDGVTAGDAPAGQLGFFGATVGGDGAEVDFEFVAYSSRPPSFAGSNAFGTVPLLNLDVVGNALNGLPLDLRGTSGGPGGKLVNAAGGQVAGGGTGGPGGSGLMIICRGISFGGGASIDLAGGDGLSGTEQTLFSHQFFSGGGGGGAPGAMYILLDGNRLVPDLSTKFSALGGDTPIDGTPMYAFFSYRNLLASPATGFKDDTRRISNVDWTTGAFRVQFVPVPETPVEDLPDTELTVHYILATNGNAIHNGSGTLTLEAHRLLAGSDELLSVGTIKLFDPGDNEVTVANGYVTGSDGYTGILDSGDITGDIIITLKDGPTGPPLDTITLVDVADGATGAPGSDGADAVYGVIEPENGLAWTRATNAGAWTPSQETTDLDCTFYQAGVEVARIARRVTLNTTDGTLTAAAIAHKGGDLNTARVNVTLIGNGSTAETVQFDYSFGGEAASVAETVSTSQGGDDGATGADGDDAVTGFIEPENGLAWTRATTAGAWTPSQLTTDLDCTFVLGGVEVARIARRITLTDVDGTLAATTTAHKGGDLNTSRVTVTVTGSASTAITVQFDYSFGGDTGSDAASVSSAQGGDDGVLHYLTNEAHVVAADNDGTGYSLSEAGGVHKVFQGVTEKTAVSVHTVVSGLGSLVVSQDETNYDNSPTREGTFAGGSGYAVSDTITLSDGTVITVDAVSSGVVTQFTVPDPTGTTFFSIGSTLTQSSTSGSGTGFTLTPDTDNINAVKTQNGLTMSVTPIGVYSLSGASWTTDLETFSLRAVFNGVSYDKEYSIAKAKGGTTGAVQLSSGTTSVTHISLSPTDAHAEWGLFADGKEKKKIGTDPYTIIGDWLISGALGDYEVECIVNSGTTPSGAPTGAGTWSVLSSFREWHLDDTGPVGPFITCNLSVSIRNKITTTVLAGPKTVVLTVHEEA